MTDSLLSRLGARALAGALAAAVVSAPITPIFAQKKPAPAAAAAPAAKKAPPTKKDKEKARESYKKGEDGFAAGDYTAALAGYRGANETIPSAQAQYKIALTLDKMGKGQDAIDAYKSFLAFPPPDSMGDQVKTSQDRIAALGTGTAKITTTPPGATIKIDGEKQLDAAPATISLKPGPHRIEAGLSDFEPQSKDVTVVSGQSLDVAFDLKALPPPPPPPPTVVASAAPPPPPPAPPPEPRSKIPAYVTLGLGGAGAIVGTIFGLKALSAKSDFKAAHTTDNADSAERNALIADMAFGIAITLGITGTVLLVAGDKKAEEPAKAATRFRLTPIVTPQTQGAAAVVTFLGLLSRSRGSTHGDEEHQEPLLSLRDHVRRARSRRLRSDRERRSHRDPR